MCPLRSPPVRVLSPRGPAPRRSLAGGWRGPKARRAGTAGGQRAYSGTFGCGEGGSTRMFFPEETKLKIVLGVGKWGVGVGFPPGADGLEGGCWCQGQDRRRGTGERGPWAAMCKPSTCFWAWYRAVTSKGTPRPCTDDTKRGWPGCARDSCGRC